MVCAGARVWILHGVVVMDEDNDCAVAPISDLADRALEMMVQGGSLRVMDVPGDSSFASATFSGVVAVEIARRAAIAQAPAPVRVKRGYCTDCEMEVPIQADGRGGCGHGRILAALEPDAGVAELVEAHRENARVLSHLHNELQGRVDAAKLAALFECLARSTAALALIAHNTTEIRA